MSWDNGNNDEDYDYGSENEEVENIGDLYDEGGRSAGMKQKKEEEEKYADENGDEIDYQATFSDRERVGLTGAIGAEIGGVIEGIEKTKTKRDRALIDIIRISHDEPFSSLSQNQRSQIEQTIVKVKGIEFYDLIFLYSAAVFYMKNRDNLTKETFEKHQETYGFDIERKKGKEEEMRKNSDEITLVRYIRKIIQLEK